MTKIEWCDETWSPISGCTPASEACLHCYAKTMANRLKAIAIKKGWDSAYIQDDPFKVTFHPNQLDKPLKWKKPRTVFVCSMGDIFHEDVEIDWIEKVAQTISRADWHTYLLLTKRPENINGRILCHNTWVGVTVENQEQAEKRLPILYNLHGSIKRFVSCEPLLGPVDLSPWIDKLDWIICGGETGPSARPLYPEWVYDIGIKCKINSVPFFFKQWGEWISCEHESYMSTFDTEKYKEHICNNGRGLYRVGKKNAGDRLSDNLYKEYPTSLKHKE